MGAWIEIIRVEIVFYHFNVAPLVGAWIEISFDITSGRPSYVAPLVGAWIEILRLSTSFLC